jgi:hypothetical protein
MAHFMGLSRPLGWDLPVYEGVFVDTTLVV